MKSAVCRQGNTGSFHLAYQSLVEIIHDRPFIPKDQRPKNFYPQSLVEIIHDRPFTPRERLRRESNIIIRVVGEPDTLELSTLDPEILLWCEETGFILVTNNRTSMPLHLAEHIAQNRHVPGIFILNPDLSIGQNLDELIIIAKGSFDDEYQDQIIHLPLT